jgi:AcrR family transcriptional regulator
MAALAPATGLRERHKHQRRERILEAIRELLREFPSETPTVERIAELADVSPATVFNLVGPREQQWAEVADALLRELDARLALTADEDPRERARMIVSEAVELFIADSAVSQHLVNSWGRSATLMRENPIPHLRAAIRQGQELGILRPDLNIGALAGHIAIACGGALRQWAAGQIGDDAFRARTRFAVDVVFAAAASEDFAATLHAPLIRTRRQGSQ